MVKKERNAKANDLAEQILENYQPKSVQDMQEALKDIFGPMFESMLKGEMNHHLGYETNSKEKKIHQTDVMDMERRPYRPVQGK
jgi:putative transposase